MARIRSKDTRPERAVRRWLFAHGYRFRLHSPSLPGRPDIVIPRLKTVVEVRGCFWHRHAGCRLAYTPKSNRKFWLAKFEANVRRDKRSATALRRLGWSVLTIWECETASQRGLTRLLTKLRSRG